VLLVLGDGNEVFRLGRGGLSDRDLENSWSCVAVDGNSMFYDVWRTLEG